MLLNVMRYIQTNKKLDSRSFCPKMMDLFRLHGFHFPERYLINVSYCPVMLLNAT